MDITGSFSFVAKSISVFQLSWTPFQQGLSIQQDFSESAVHTVSSIQSPKRGVADHVTKFKHPEDPQLGFLTIVAVEVVKEKKDLIVWEIIGCAIWAPSSGV